MRSIIARQYQGVKKIAIASARCGTPLHDRLLVRWPTVTCISWLIILRLKRVSTFAHQAAPERGAFNVSVVLVQTAEAGLSMAETNCAAS